MTIVYESGNRRAEVQNNKVAYFRKSGKKKQGLVGVWFHECEDETKAKRLAQGWAFKTRLKACISLPVN